MSEWLPQPLAGPATVTSFAGVPVPDLLVGAGFPPAAADRVRTSLQRCAGALPRATDDAAVSAFFVPGRIEVLGKHTDYAGGRSLVCAVERGFTLVARAREDRTITVCDAVAAESVELAWDPDLDGAPGTWPDYARTVVRRLARDFECDIGADIAFASDLPAASGLSSSSALVISLLLGLAAANDLDGHTLWRRAIPDSTALAAYAAAVENGLPFGPLRASGGVGTLGGSQDHAAILCARAGSLLQLAFLPLRIEATVATPADHVFVIGSSGLRAQKTAAALDSYNRLAGLAAEAAAVWRDRSGEAHENLGAALNAGLHDRVLETLAHAGRADLYGRAAQFFEEAGTLIPSAGEALARGDVTAFGYIVARSQELAERKLGNQVPATIDLVRIARDLGAGAASAFGAGFGGSVWALVARSDAEGFAHEWRREYVARHPANASAASFFRTGAAPAAVRIV